ncbi:predicted protein [Sclerotinia sclerotiorum 1980 UF-70]|uniref:Uncharacterized protein n=1 Tax=Sclerotinia sclerotiorum (strain ATCC 18683 / 1980 / Ss-1) TaxID=665079 RepID=A7ESV8_SCLS1|nr:predicted protein [Sclerotinia sclerotiorum 1980 UF-70]EDN92550.1 predicted protein [Sclerotinia sclerotiorum 1980 UF-70]
MEKQAQKASRFPRKISQTPTATEYGCVHFEGVSIGFSAYKIMHKEVNRLYIA